MNFPLKKKEQHNIHLKIECHNIPLEIERFFLHSTVCSSFIGAKMFFS